MPDTFIAISLPVGNGLYTSALRVSLVYAIIVGLTVTLDEYPLESVALNTKLVVETLPKVLVFEDGATLLIVLDEIVAELLAVALIVATAVDLYLISVDELPVNATVVAFVSTTAPVTVGPPVAVTVNVQVVALPSWVVLLELL